MNFVSSTDQQLWMLLGPRSVLGWVTAKPYRLADRSRGIMRQFFWVLDRADEQKFSNNVAEGPGLPLALAETRYGSVSGKSGSG